MADNIPPQTLQLGAVPERTLSISELTKVLIKHYGITEGRWEATFNLGLMVGGFKPTPSEPAFPGVTTVVQGVALQPGRPDSEHSVDASSLS